jgi:hypothetical protein
MSRKTHVRGGSISRLEWSGATRWHDDMKREGASYGDQSAGYGEPIAPMAMVRCGVERSEKKGQLVGSLPKEHSRE